MEDNMNAMVPGAAIDEELRHLGEHLDEQLSAAAVEANGSRQSFDEKRGIFELRLGQYLGLFNLACRINKDWRTSVFRGETPPSDEMAAAMRGVFERWLSLNDHFRQRLEYFEHHGPCLGDHALHLRLYADEARKLLQEWRAPSLSTAVGLRTIPLSPQGAAKIREMLAEPSRPAN
jgi:hypothetical protein